MTNKKVDIRREYTPKEREELAQALNYSIERNTKHKTDDLSYDYLIQALDEDIYQAASRGKFRKILGRVSRFIRKKHRPYSSHFTLEEMKNFRSLLSNEKVLVQEILDTTQDSPNVNDEFLNNLEGKLADLEQDWNSKWTEHSGYLEREALFQFPHRARAAFQSFLDMPTEEIGNVYFESMENLRSYAAHHKELAEDVLKKLGEVYRIDNQRGRDGKRRLGYISFGAGGLPLSLADCALTCMRDIGRNLGLDEERTYSLAGLSFKQIEEDKNAWSKKAEEIIAREGLYHEYEGKIKIQIVEGGKTK